MANKYFVEFILEYEDGSTYGMFVGRNALMSGDDVVQIVVRQKQRNRELPGGKIVGVRRAPAA